MALKDVMKELYTGSKCTKLATTIVLIILCTIHRVNNKFVDEFFTFLCHHLILELNFLTTNYYGTRALTQKLGLNYENTHACVEGPSCFEGIIRMILVVPNVEMFNTRIL